MMILITITIMTWDVLTITSETWSHYVGLFSKLWHHGSPLGGPTDFLQQPLSVHNILKLLCTSSKSHFVGVLLDNARALVPCDYIVSFVCPGETVRAHNGPEKRRKDGWGAPTDGGRNHLPPQANITQPPRRGGGAGTYTRGMVAWWLREFRAIFNATH